MPAQWEYQVGPTEGIDMGDDLWVSRYLLQVSIEYYGSVCFEITFRCVNIVLLLACR